MGGKQKREKDVMPKRRYRKLKKDQWKTQKYLSIE